MKNSILVVGMSLVILNTLIGLILRDYSNFNLLFADLSIILSTVFLYFLFNSSISDGFKIGVGFFTVFIGLGKFLCAVFSPQKMENNILLIIFISLVFVEFSVVLLAKLMSKK